MMTDEAPKDNLFAFLRTLESRTHKSLPDWESFEQLVEGSYQKIKDEKHAEERLGNTRENIPLYKYVIPVLFSCLVESGLNNQEAKASIRCEYHRLFPHLSAGNCFRKPGYIFGKRLIQNPAAIARKWKSQPSSTPANQAFPDLSLRSPFSSKIVFDVKYFKEEDEVAADKALVEGCYEVAHYRSLPATEDYWGYDYGCLLAFDASKGQHLRRSWNAVRCKNLFWRDAHIMVLIVGRDLPVGH